MPGRHAERMLAPQRVEVEVEVWVQIRFAEAGIDAVRPVLRSELNLGLLRKSRRTGLAAAEVSSYVVAAGRPR